METSLLPDGSTRSAGHLRLSFPGSSSRSLGAGQFMDNAWPQLIWAALLQDGLAQPLVAPNGANHYAAHAAHAPALVPIGPPSGDPGALWKNHVHSCPSLVLPLPFLCRSFTRPVAILYSSCAIPLPFLCNSFARPPALPLALRCPHL